MFRFVRNNLGLLDFIRIKEDCGKRREKGEVEEEVEEKIILFS